MVTNLPTFQKLARQLHKVPYLASKNIYKVAAYFLSTDKKVLEQLCATILAAKDSIHHCVKCMNWVEGGELCSICAAPGRDAGVICVVETWFDLFAIESVGDYKGIYHVLGGALSPLDGIGPEKLAIDLLISRVDDSVREIIFATNPTPEGDATTSFICSKIDKSAITVSRLASGVPIGSALEFMDRLTIGKALVGRRPF